MARTFPRDHRDNRLAGDGKRGLLDDDNNLRSSGGRAVGDRFAQARPSMAQQLGVLHSLPTVQCPFERSLSRMFACAVDVVSRNAVNPDFLPDDDKDKPQQKLLARIERELPVRLCATTPEVIRDKTAIMSLRFRPACLPCRYPDFQFSRRTR